MLGDLKHYIPTNNGDQTKKTVAKIMRFKLDCFTQLFIYSQKPLHYAVLKGKLVQPKTANC